MGIGVDSGSPGIRGRAGGGYQGHAEWEIDGRSEIPPTEQAGATTGDIAMGNRHAGL
jgi:hypothetical protein